jgi:geranylgeranyl pyrophosphate synthase
MQTTREFLAHCVEIVNAELELQVPRADVEPVRLHEAVRWSLFAGGKRFRPAVLLAVGDTFGAEQIHLIRAAAAIEMVHTFSLIHDDLPAMDDDDLRRGRATCHKKFGEATAILAGDVLQTLAFRVLAEDERLPPETRVRVIAIVANASGTPSGMVAGQQLDLEAEGHHLPIAEIEGIHSRKTGALITAAAAVGAVIGNASVKETGAIERYSSRLGLLFQITDDILDVTQSTELMGKATGKDAGAQKATYPGRLGIAGASELGARVRDEAIEALAPIGRNTELLESLANYILLRTT